MHRLPRYLAAAAVTPRATAHRVPQPRRAAAAHAVTTPRATACLANAAAAAHDHACTAGGMHRLPRGNYLPPHACSHHTHACRASDMQHRDYNCRSYSRPQQLACMRIACRVTSRRSNHTHACRATSSRLPQLAAKHDHACTACMHAVCIARRVTGRRFISHLSQQPQPCKHCSIDCRMQPPRTMTTARIMHRLPTVIPAAAVTTPRTTAYTDCRSRAFGLGGMHRSLAVTCMELQSPCMHDADPESDIIAIATRSTTTACMHASISLAAAAC